MEEKLLFMLKSINNSLKNNMEIIADQKPRILMLGAEHLVGKNCTFINNTIEYKTPNYMRSYNFEDIYTPLEDLHELTEEFDKLNKLNEEFTSEFRYSDISKIEPTALLSYLIWFINKNNMEYFRINFFCKKAMEAWIKKYFILPLEQTNEGQYLTEEQTTKTILNASTMLDHELMTAFQLETRLDKYICLLKKNTKRIEIFSRFNK